jgi:hypothetical protein
LNINHTENTRETHENDPEKIFLTTAKKPVFFRNFSDPFVPSFGKPLFHPWAPMSAVGGFLTILMPQW